MFLVLFENFFCDKFHKIEKKNYHLWDFIDSLAIEMQLKSTDSLNSETVFEIDEKYDVVDALLESVAYYYSWGR